MAEISFKRLAELPILLAFFSYLLIAPIATNFVIYRTCYTIFAFNRTDCAKLGTTDADNFTQEIEQQVQPYANVVMMTQTVVTQIVPALLCLFIGPWSDKNGRRPIMISTTLGFVIRGLVTMVVVLVDYLSPWYLLFANVPTAPLGGLATLMMAVLCYVTEVTSEANRGIRMAVVEGMTALGMLLGTLCSSFVFAAGGYVLVFGMDILCSILGCVYVTFVLTETIPENLEQDETAMFNLRNVIEMFKATFRVRENYGRAILLTTFAISTIAVLAFSADGAVIFMFLRQKLHWDLEHYTLFSSVNSLIGVVGTFGGVVLFHKLLKITETPLIIVGCLSYLSGALVQGFASLDWHIYLAGSIRSIYGIMNPMCRSLISKLITKEEIGKIFSIAVAVESLTVMMGSPMYTLIYNYTLYTNPGVFNFVSAGMFAINIVLVVVVMVIQRRIRTAHSYDVLSVNAEEE